MTEKNPSLSPRGVGIDIVEIERIKDGLSRHGQAFLDKILTPKEQAYCQKQQDPYPRIAGRFAAKEAVVKALGTGFGKEISCLDIEILPDEKGRPTVTLKNGMSNTPPILVSISHCLSHATAVAIC